MRLCVVNSDCVTLQESARASANNYGMENDLVYPRSCVCVCISVGVCAFMCVCIVDECVCAWVCV
jgi:hypothetical protein